MTQTMQAFRIIWHLATRLLIEYDGLLNNLGSNKPYVNLVHEYTLSFYEDGPQIFAEFRTKSEVWSSCW